MPRDYLHMLSPTARSNLFTKGVTARTDKRQAVANKYTVPKDPEVRLLLAKLMLEETLETIEALGVTLMACGEEERVSVTMVDLVWDARGLASCNLDKIIDGACDTIYVATGVLCAVGAPDLPHLREVAKCNDAKFPGGVARVDPLTGKYLKPLGWVGPDHQAVGKRWDFAFPMTSLAQQFVEEAK